MNKNKTNKESQNVETANNEGVNSTDLLGIAVTIAGLALLGLSGYISISSYLYYFFETEDIHSRYSIICVLRVLCFFIATAIIIPAYSIFIDKIVCPDGDKLKKKTNAN